MKTVKRKKKNMYIYFCFVFIVRNRPGLRIWKTECGHAECSSAERADRQLNGPAPTSPFWVGYLFNFYFIFFLWVHPVCGFSRSPHIFVFTQNTFWWHFILILFLFFYSFAADFPEAQRRSHHCHRRRERSNRLHGGRRPSRSCHQLGVGYKKIFFFYFTFVSSLFPQDSWNNHL